MTVIVGNPRKRNKYRNKPTGGFASKKEAARYAELLLLQSAGEIRNLRTQVRYEIIPKQDGERAAHYVADFVYDTPIGGWDVQMTVVEDAKGFRTADYVLKRKLMLHVHCIRIQEV